MNNKTRNVIIIIILLVILIGGGYLLYSHFSKNSYNCVGGHCKATRNGMYSTKEGCVKNCPSGLAGVASPVTSKAPTFESKAASPRQWYCAQIMDDKQEIGAACLPCEKVKGGDRSYKYDGTLCSVGADINGKLTDRLTHPYDYNSYHNFKRCGYGVEHGQCENPVIVDYEVLPTYLGGYVLPWSWGCGGAGCGCSSCWSH